jgi:uncharacterized membrane protein
MRFRRTSDERERGAVLILTSIMLVVLMGTTALVVDLGALRGSARVDQCVADSARARGRQGPRGQQPGAGLHQRRSAT